VADRSIQKDGVRVVATSGVRKSVWLVAAALALVALSALLLARLAADAPAPAPPPPPAPLAADAPAPEPEQPARVARAKREPVAGRARARRVEPPAPRAEEPAFTLPPPGEKTGMALFPPPGTKPIKAGIVVPEGFELPEGYVRHFQTTDDGEMLEPVLLFHPDYEWLDEAGAPIALPADRVVPVELAPEGMPIRMLEPPETEGAR
jgi:hypothetical protein